MSDSGGKHVIAAADSELIHLLLGPGGLLVALLIIIYTGIKKIWVFGWYAREVRADRDEWKEAALRGTRVAERVVTQQEEVRNRDVQAP